MKGMDDAIDSANKAWGSGCRHGMRDCRTAVGLRVLTEGQRRPDRLAVLGLLRTCRRAPAHFGPVDVHQIGEGSEGGAAVMLNAGRGTLLSRHI